ncbi:MAG: MFS transporter [Acidimicrobiia bacterium]|nr:MFS transporter [Acidimicrobiia bacterium]
MDLGLTRRRLFVMFGAVYFVQGVIQAYQLNFFKPHMDSEGIDADRLAVVASLALVPFVIKWVFGMVSDRVPLFGRGHRVPYMLIGLTSTAVAFGVAFFIDPSESFGILATMVLAATFFMALFDTTADALAVDAVPAIDHGPVQAWMNGGRAIGLVAVSLGFGLVADAFGYRYIFAVIALLLLIPLWFVNQVQEPAERGPVHTFDPSAFRVLTQGRYLLFAAVLVLAWTFFQGIDGLVTFYMANELGASGSQIGVYGTLKGIGLLAGGTLLAFLVRRAGRRTAAMTTLAAVTAGGLVLSVTASIDVLLWLAPVWGLAVGLQWTNYVTFTMGITDLRVAGTMFAVLQTMSNIGIGAGEGIATALSDNLGFSAVFRSLSLANLVVVPLMLAVIARFPTSANSSVAAHE